MEKTDTENTIINRVANSPLITFNLEEYYHPGERVVYDIKDNLFQEMILREKDFRAFVKENDWSVYQDKNVAIVCSVDAIVPVWAYMLLITKISPYAHLVIYGDENELNNLLFKEALTKVNLREFEGKKIVVKGCGKVPVSTYAYGEITRLLQPYVSSIMFGEPCSTVPIYKKPKN